MNPSVSRAWARGLALSFCLAAFALPALAASPRADSAKADDRANLSWQQGAIDHAQRMRQFHDGDHGAQATPPVIPQLETDFDSSGLIATYQPNGATATASNAFFQN